jgi:hypothetical protein
MAMVAPNKNIYGNIALRNRQGMDSLHSNPVEGACMGMVDVPKAGDT